MINKQEYEELITSIQEIIRFDLETNDPRELSFRTNIWDGIDIMLDEKQLTVGLSQLPKKERQFLFIAYLNKPYDIDEYMKPKPIKIEFYTYSVKQKLWVEYNPILKKIYREHCARHTIKNITEEWASILIRGVQFLDYD